MALAMARPWKHPKTGVYWLRKRVPGHLRTVLGKREEKRSLGTKDPEEAKVRHAAALVELQSRWANLESGPLTLSEREAHELAAPVHDWWLGQHRDNPSEQRFWCTDLFDVLWPPEPDQARTVEEIWATSTNRDGLAAQHLRIWCERQADALLAGKGLHAGEVVRTRLAKAVAAAMQRASTKLKSLQHGSPENDEAFAPAASHGSLTPVPRAEKTPVLFDSLLVGWAKERKPGQKTLYTWERVLKQLAGYLGHDDAARITPEDLLRWKAALIDSGLSPRSIRCSKIAAVRAVLQWGVDNRLLASNPAHRIVIDAKLRAGDGRRSFNDDEAARILRAALEERDPVRRWVPWLCAYSGARVAEVCQLRKEDIIQPDAIWCMKFDPKAGSLKNAGSERVVPIHPAVLKVGFLQFVRDAKAGPLFPDLKPDRFGSRGGTGTKVLSRWVRGLGLVDDRLSPNHSWRHRFKTVARRYGLAADIVNAITGHSQRSVGDSYGEYLITALDRELRKIPAVDLQNARKSC